MLLNKGYFNMEGNYDSFKLKEFTLGLCGKIKYNSSKDIFIYLEILHGMACKYTEVIRGYYLRDQLNEVINRYNSALTTTKAKRDHYSIVHANELINIFDLDKNIREPSVIIEHSRDNEKMLKMIREYIDVKMQYINSFNYLHQIVLYGFYKFIDKDYHKASRIEFIYKECSEIIPKREITFKSLDKNQSRDVYDNYYHDYCNICRKLNENILWLPEQKK